MLGLICVQHMRVLDFRSEEKTHGPKLQPTPQNYYSLGKRRTSHDHWRTLVFKWSEIRREQVR